MVLVVCQKYSALFTSIVTYGSNKYFVAVVKENKKQYLVALKKILHSFLGCIKKDLKLYLTTCRHNKKKSIIFTIALNSSEI